MFLKIGHGDHQLLQAKVNQLYGQSYQEREHEISYIANVFVVVLGEDAEGHEDEAQEE